MANYEIGPVGLAFEGRLSNARTLLVTGISTGTAPSFVERSGKEGVGTKREGPAD